MKKCPWCGKQFLDDAAVCSIDGNVLEPYTAKDPSIVSEDPHNRVPIPREVWFRTLSTVAVGFVGFWFPIWYINYRIPPNGDDRAGFALLPGLVVILCLSVWATDGLRSLSVIPDKKRRSRIRLTVLLFCWSPIIALLLRIFAR